MNPAHTEIMKNRFSAMVEEASTVAYRTAHTTFVKQTQDFQVALARPEGEFFAFPTMTGVTSGVCQSIRGFIAGFGNDLRPGDVLISNDPFATQGLVTHTMDIHLAMPIFFEGRLMCWAWAFVHASDIGGAVPGSISPDLTEIYQEGIRIRPAKLRTEGRLNQDFVHLLQDNSRIGSEVWGDLQAMQSAMRLLDDRVNALCWRIGADAFQGGIEQVMAYAEAKSRSVIAGLRDGTYVFSDYLEGDGPDDAVHIRCRLTVSGDEAEIDYEGSDPQVHAAMNFATGNRSHPFLCLALTNYIQTAEPSTPVNGGIMRPIRARAPLGTVMNASHPAAMGNRWVAVMRTYDALMGCINQAVEGGLTACGAGQAGIVSAAWPDPLSGKNRVSVVEPFSGGSGGRCRAEGVDANDTMVGYLKSTPVENVEVDVPLVVRRHELVPQSFGHGTYRGGAAVCLELQCRTDDMIITVRGLDRFRFQPWGVFGGTAGSNGRATLNPGTAGEKELGRIKVLHLSEGDRVRLVSSAGGGFGSPLDREASRVLDDLRNGFIDLASAQETYGVVVTEDAVDEAATTERRARLRAERGEPAWIDLGPARQDYEARWPSEAIAALASAVLREPQGRRRGLLASVRKRIAQLSERPAAAEVVAMVEERAAALRDADRA